jgi:hypothetical protein
MYPALRCFGYSDVLLLPVYERRFYLNLKTRDVMKQNKTATDNQPRGKQNKLSGDNLKNE